MAPRTLDAGDTAAIAPTELRLTAHRLRNLADDVDDLGIAGAGTATGILRLQAINLDALADALDAAATP